MGLLGIVLGAVACSRSPRENSAKKSASQVPSGVSSGAAALPGADPAGRDPLRSNHLPGPAASPLWPQETTEELRALLPVPSSAQTRGGVAANEVVSRILGAGHPSRMNRGNHELAFHAISRAQCQAGLAPMTLQTDRQRQQCGGAPGMVPLYKRGRISAAKACIDLFEYPNLPCELPFVWVSPTQAATLCELAGKRLCTQEEWVLACRGDPQGGKDWAYAYGRDLDLTACHTNLSSVETHPHCDATSAASAWKSCGTNTEPAGSFPRCRSRFGVFDLHGNVAEIMMRRDQDGQRYSQLKGSSFFYVDVARGHRDGPQAVPGRETYPDTCTYDPRWHVEPIENAWHVNYHLGFRCCKSLDR